MEQPTVPASSAVGISWNLSDLYQSVDDPKIGADLAGALERARAFEARYRGKIETLDAASAGLLREALIELEGLFEQLDRPAVYAGLVHAAKTDDSRHGALLSRTREERTASNKHLIFFDLEWVKVADDVVAKLLANPSLARYRHHLEQKRIWRPHYLSELEEKILDEKSVTGRAAFVRLFDESVSAMQFPFEHAGASQKVSQQQILAKLYDPDRTIRKAAARGLTVGLQENSRLLTFIFNNLVLDHHGDCRLRKYPHFMSSRHLSNEITDEVVEALMTATERHHSLVQRYYRLKGKLLGIDQLHDYDRYAPIHGDMPECDWPRARRMVQESYQAFSPRAGGIIGEFFDKNWIDAELRPGKRGGAFSSSAVPSAHPYILMNYTDRLRDVMTLAHELGHGLHQYLSRGVGYLQCDTPLTTAEMASVFGEMLTFQRLLEMFPDPRIRLGLLCGKIEDAFATVFRQVVLTRFEQGLHQARKDKGELSTEQINDIWMAANRPMHGDAVLLTDDYAWWWLYIGHFIHVPFYCYAYAFGELLVLALVQKYRQDGPAFVPRYLDLLAAGGSEAPHVLLGKLGMNVNDPTFWELGLKLLGDMVGEAEKLAG
ncbi:MAG: M3 family oligoendopeptidase [Planctomycetes bacterium]|nr:M3 family oligoendopeptidase [Planctomycetota bacterium]